MMVLKPAEIKFCSRRASRHLQQKPSRRPPIFQRDVVAIVVGVSVKRTRKIRFPTSLSTNFCRRLTTFYLRCLWLSYQYCCAWGLWAVTLLGWRYKELLPHALIGFLSKPPNCRWGGTSPWTLWHTFPEKRKKDHVMMVGFPKKSTDRDISPSKMGKLILRVKRLEPLILLTSECLLNLFRRPEKRSTTITQ